MTLRDTLTGSVAGDSYDSKSPSEAMLLMESLQKISAVDDEEEQRASLTDLQSRTSSHFRERWKDFQVLRERLESEPLSPKFSEQEFALDVISEGGDAFDDQHLGIDELMEELNMPQDLREEIYSTIQQTKSFYPEVEESTYVEKERDHSDSEEELEQFAKHHHHDETKQSPELDTTCMAEDIAETSVKEDNENGYLPAGETDDFDKMQSIYHEQAKMLAELEQEPDQVQETDPDRKELEETETDRENDFEPGLDVDACGPTKPVSRGKGKEEEEEEEEEEEGIDDEHKEGVDRKREEKEDEKQVEEVEEYRNEVKDSKDEDTKEVEERDEEIGKGENERGEEAEKEAVEEEEKELEEEERQKEEGVDNRDDMVAEETDEEEGGEKESFEDKWEEEVDEDNNEEEEREEVGAEKEEQDKIIEENNDEEELDEVIAGRQEEEEVEDVIEKNEEEEVEEVIEEQDEKEEWNDKVVEEIDKEEEGEEEVVEEENEEEEGEEGGTEEKEGDGISEKNEEEDVNEAIGETDEEEQVDEVIEEKDEEGEVEVIIEEKDREEEVEDIIEEKDEGEEDEEEELEEEGEEAIIEEKDEEEEVSEDKDEKEEIEEREEEAGEVVEDQNTEAGEITDGDGEEEANDKDNNINVKEKWDEAEERREEQENEVNSLEEEAIREEEEEGEESEVDVDMEAEQEVEGEDLAEEGGEEDEEKQGDELNEGCDQVEEQESKDEEDEENRCVSEPVSADADSIAESKVGKRLLEEAYYLQQSSCEEDQANDEDTKRTENYVESSNKSSSDGQCEDDKGNGTDTVNELKTDDGEEEEDEERSSSLPHPVEISQELLDFVNSALQSSSLIFTYDARGNIRIEPDNARVIHTKQVIIPKSKEDSQYGLKRLPSPSTSDLSDYRPETSDSGGYKTQESTDIATESGEEPSESPSPDCRHSRHMTDKPNGRTNVERADSKQSVRSKSELLQSSRLKSGGSFSSYNSGTKASREDLSYFSGASSLKIDTEPAVDAAQCISFPSEVDSNDGVLIDQGRWLLKENHLIRKSPPISIGMYGNIDTTSIDTAQENNSEDSPPHTQHNPLAVISSSELEEMAKPQTPKCTYYNMSHGSDSDPFLDDVSVKSGKKDTSSVKGRGLRVSPTIDTSKTWTKKNGSLSSFASVEFKMPDSRVHPEGESSAVTQARRPSGVGGRVLQAQDSLDTLHVRCGQYCPIL
ncbi:golgin subfamily A member 6-like protein 25 [Centroberyx affinis]|uniref:golgin subfamily A member 6-like protein 25 n=1 Tax=Centroberyx affinis TaxID=166261 RepID=UPI003A5BEB3D